MILKETILSAFTERGTLLKWLKKVEAALNNAVLTNISVEQISATQVKLKFTFENGDFVESPVITLPRGEKGEKGEDGLDGEGIAATIEVGTVTTGAAGTDASVTNVGTEQRAVLNFVIPRGESGEDGSAGVGFDDATRIELNSGENTLTAGTNGLNVSATFKVTAGDEIFEIPSTMFLAVKGSESIVIDVDESGTFFDIHLDADIVSKLSRVLVTPMSAPASVSLVAVDTLNAQTLLTVGEGLSVSGGVISTSGGDGKQLYKHNIYCYSEDSMWVTFSIINDNPNTMARTDIVEYFTTYLPVVGTNDFTSTIYSASGAAYAGGKLYIVVGLRHTVIGVTTPSDEISIIGISIDNSGTDPNSILGYLDSYKTFTDTVITL